MSRMSRISDDEAGERSIPSQQVGAAGGRPAPGRKAAARRRLGLPAKLAIAVVAIGTFAFLFLRSIRGSRAEPYRIDAAHLRGWTVALARDSGPEGPLLVLQVPGDLTGGLFNQIFARNMESLRSPAAPAIPLLLRSEFERSFARHTTPEALLALAVAARLDATTVSPRCMAYRRTEAGMATLMVYFVELDSDAVERFRRQLRATLPAGPEASDFDPAALSPILIVGASDSRFDRWLPLRANPAADCVAPVVVSEDTRRAP